ncbi:MAG: glutathione S-transferase C-terminal domain-containing protein [Gammaproteobacteria bacterium]|nr:glutathione S-transferase C-terminal domain-containing protein [Gammaproteobacteria bacterium]
MHLQWTSFAQSEMEAWLWSSAKHKSFYPEEKRVPAVIEPNMEEFRNGAAAMDAALADTPYLVGGAFSVTDIIVSWTVNWGRRMGQLDEFANLQAYLARLHQREHCTLNPE